MSKPLAYGADVHWEAGEIVAFRIFNDICRKQALAIFNADRAGLPRPASRPATEIASEARRIANQSREIHLDGVCIKSNMSRRAVA